jgi:ribose 5-phosphate isomerase B
VLGARMLGEELAKECLATFLATPFAGGRHQGRIDKITPGK